MNLREKVNRGWADFLPDGWTVTFNEGPHYVSHQIYLNGVNVATMYANDLDPKLASIAPEFLPEIYKVVKDAKDKNFNQYESDRETKLEIEREKARNAMRDWMMEAPAW